MEYCTDFWVWKAEAGLEMPMSLMIGDKWFQCNIIPFAEYKTIQYDAVKNLEEIYISAFGKWKIRGMVLPLALINSEKVQICEVNHLVRSRAPS